MLTSVSTHSELMHHYTTVMYQLGARDAVVHLWRFYIPQQAFKHSFLLHGLLAFTALHLAYLKPHDSPRYLSLGDKHQAIALESFQSILSSNADPDPDMADALFALSATLSLSSMARSCALSANTTMNMDDIAELFIMTKGIQNMIRLSSEHIRRGPMATMLEYQTRPEGTETELPLPVSVHFEALRQILVMYGLDPEALEDCQSALTQLEEIYKNIIDFAPVVDIEIGDISRWQVHVSMGYVRLIQVRNQPALIILAYYAAAITAIHTAWYIHNWAEYALRGISQSLNNSMQHLIEWPLEQLQNKMSELGVRSTVDASTLDHTFATLGLATRSV